MITQRQIDIWHVEAQAFAQRIREEFMQSLNNGRQPPQQAQPQPQQQAQPQQQVRGGYGTTTE